jgi:hypothetical protein
MQSYGLGSDRPAGSMSGSVSDASVHSRNNSSQNLADPSIKGGNKI